MVSIPIVAGAAGGGLLLVVIVICCCHRQRSKRREERVVRGHHPTHVDNLNETWDEIPDPADAEHSSSHVRQKKVRIQLKEDPQAAISDRSKHAPQSKSKVEFNIGDRVTVDGYSSGGTVRFVGPHRGSGNPRVGVELDTCTGKHNGTTGGHRYFVCDDGYGIIVVPRKVSKITSVQQVLPLEMGGQEQFKTQKDKQRKKSNQTLSINWEPGQGQDTEVDALPTPTGTPGKDKSPKTLSPTIKPGTRFIFPELSSASDDTGNLVGNGGSSAGIDAVEGTSNLRHLQKTRPKGPERRRPTRKFTVTQKLSTPANHNEAHQDERQQNETQPDVAFPNITENENGTLRTRRAKTLATAGQSNGLAALQGQLAAAAAQTKLRPMKTHPSPASISPDDRERDIRGVNSDSKLRARTLSLPNQDPVSIANATANKLQSSEDDEYLQLAADYDEDTSSDEDVDGSGRMAIRVNRCETDSGLASSTPMPDFHGLSTSTPQEQDKFAFDDSFSAGTETSTDPDMTVPGLNKSTASHKSTLMRDSIIDDSFDFGVFAQNPEDEDDC